MNNKVMQKSFVWNTIGYISYLGFQWLITILVVRLSGYLDAGILSLAMSTTSMFHLIAGYGMRSFQISDTGVYSNKEYLYSRYLTCIGAFLLCIIFVLVNDYSYIQIINIIFYMIFKLGEAFVDVYNGMLQKIWRLDIVGKSYCIRGILSVVTFSFILYFSQDLSFSILCMGLSTWLVIIFYDKRWTYKLINVLDRVEIKKIFILLKECLPLVIFNFITSYINFIPRYELERTVGTEMLGIYSSISSPTLIVQSFAQVLFIPLIPLFATHFNSKRIKSFCKLLAKCIGILLAIGIVTFIGASLFGEFIFGLLLGSQIKEYIYLLFPVIGCTLMVALMWLISNILIALRCLKTVIISGVIGLLISFIGSPLLIREFGANGVSWSQIISLISICFCMIIVLIKTIRNKLVREG